MIKNLFLFLITFFSIINIDNSLSPNDNIPNAPAGDNKPVLNEIKLDINSEAGILMEISSGKILFSKNEEKRLYPASMTKMMGLYLIFEGLENNLFTLNDEVCVSSNAASMGGTQIYLETNEIMKVEDLIKSVAINSANDAMVALAEYHSSSEEEFVNNMNKKAKEFNMLNTNYVNSTGFDDPNHYTCAKDMAYLCKRLIEDYGDYFIKYSSILEAYVREESSNPFWLVNTNKLLRYYDGLDCGKTGFTSTSKYCLTTSAKRSNVRFIAVAMKAETKEKRSQDITKMLNYGFSKFQSMKLFSMGNILTNCKFDNSDSNNTPIGFNKDIYISIPKEISKDDLEITYELLDLKAPKNKGDVVGVLKVKVDDYYYEFDLVCLEDVYVLSYENLFYKTLLDILF